MIMKKFQEIRKIMSQIQFLDECIEETRNQMKIHAMQYSDIPKIVGYRDNVLETLMCKLTELENKKNRLQVKVDVIKEELSVLPEIAYKVALYKIVYNLTWNQISQKVGYSRASCFRFFEQATHFKLY